MLLSEDRKRLIRLIILGLVASLFFSATFVLNRKMGLEGGHWVWTASLRYFYMLIILSLWLVLTAGMESLGSVITVFRDYWKFWLLAGTVGFGIFYAPLSFAASYAPGWVIASTWQATILATPLVLFLFFRKRVPFQGIVFSILIFAGILLANLEQTSLTITGDTFFFGILPVLLAALAYPTGNQLVGEAKQGAHQYIPHITNPIMNRATARVLLMTLGSIPFWILLIIITAPPTSKNRTVH